MERFVVNRGWKGERWEALVFLGGGKERIEEAWLMRCGCFGVRTCFNSLFVCEFGAAERFIEFTAALEISSLRFYSLSFEGWLVLDRGVNHGGREAFIVVVAVIPVSHIQNVCIYYLLGMFEWRH